MARVAAAQTILASNGSTTVELPFAGEYHLSLERSFYCSTAGQTVVIDTTDVAVTLTVTCWSRSRRVPP